MPKAYDTWNPLPHRAIEQLASRVWRVEGDLPNMPLKRVMTIAKRADGALVIHNAAALDDASMKRIDDWGAVGFVIVPNGYHRLDAKVFKDRYPSAKVLCPLGARKKVEQVVPVDGSYADFPKDDAISMQELDGTKQAEGVLIVRSGEADVTLVFNDAIFNMPHLSGFQGFVFRHLTQSSGGPRVSRLARLAIVKDKPAFAAHLDRLASLPNLARIIVSHHLTIDRDPASTLRGVAASLR